jgi:maleylacetoacetate isomerase
LPETPAERAVARSLSQTIACDIHPLNNLRVLTYLRHELKHGEEEIERWTRHWISAGLAALEPLCVGPYLMGRSIFLPDLCLVPQLASARRFGVDLSPYPRLVEADAQLHGLWAVQAAAPERQSDAPRERVEAAG